MRRFAAVFAFVLLLVLLSGGLIVRPGGVRRHQTASTILPHRLTWVKPDYHVKPAPPRTIIKPEVEVRESESDEASSTARVVDMDTGEPVAGVSVRITVYGEGEARAFEAISGENGRFPVPMIKEGEAYFMSLEHKDYRKLPRYYRGEIPDTLKIGKPATLIGYALDTAGNPLPLSRASLWVGQSCYSPSVIEGNRFEIPELAEGQYKVYVQPEGFYRLEKGILLKSGETQTVHFTFDPGIEAFGTARDTEGNPIEGVLVIRWKQPNEFGPPQELAVTDVNGWYSFRWPINSYGMPEPSLSIYFVKQGYSHEWIVKWTEGPPREKHVVMGNHASSIKGTVTASGVPFEGTLYVGWRVCSKHPYVEVKEGKFSIDGIRPGTHDIVFHARGYYPMTVELEVPKEKPAQVNLVFTDRGGQVTGEVLDIWGRPVAAKVYCFGLDRQLIGPYHTHTDATGKYTIGGLSDGRYNIQADPKSPSDLAMSGAIPVIVMRGQVRTNVDFVLDAKSK